MLSKDSKEWVIPGVKCFHCHEREPTILYMISLSMEDEIVHLCTKCAEGIAIGMLRDVSELKGNGYSVIKLL